MKRGKSVSVKVIQEVASQEDVNPCNLTPPLYEVIDPDALDALFEQTGHRPVGPTIKFQYNGYAVTVDKTGTVHVAETAKTAEIEENSIDE